MPSDSKGENDKKSKKKSKRKDEPVIALSDAEIEKTRKDIKKLKDKITSLEADWDFDKKKAEEIYLKQVEKFAEENRQKQIKEREELKKLQEEKKKEEEEETPVMDGFEDNEDDDEEGGMFGGLMMDEEQESTPVAAAASSTITIQRNIVDLTVPKSWMGKYPKDLLSEYCNKQKFGKQSFTSVNVGAGMWLASLKIVQGGYSSVPLKFELHEELAASNRHDAEQLIALHALFELDSDSSLYKVLANSYKDLWTVWFEEKVREILHINRI